VKVSPKLAYLYNHAYKRFIQLKWDLELGVRRVSFQEKEGCNPCGYYIEDYLALITVMVV
jgi:hypothetical protein